MNIKNSTDSADYKDVQEYNTVYSGELQHSLFSNSYYSWVFTGSKFCRYLIDFDRYGVATLFSKLLGKSDDGLTWTLQIREG